MAPGWCRRFDTTSVFGCLRPRDSGSGSDGSYWRVQMATPPKDPLRELYRRPGFMIRRMQQISVSIFIEETGKLKVTNRQWGILFVLSHRPGINQISVANLLGLDRSTTGMVLEKLEKDGLVVRAVDPGDRRRHNLQLTQSGTFQSSSVIPWQIARASGPILSMKPNIRPDANG